MTAADYTPYLQGGRELGQQQGQNIGGINGTGTSLPLSDYLYSNNSLNITTQQPVEKGAQTPQQVDTPNSLKSSKTTQLGTPTAMTDLLAMLDDNTAFSDMVQQQEERQWDIERHRNKFTTQLSSATTSGDTTTTTDLSPQVLMQQEVPMNMVSRSASAGLLEAVGDKQTPLMPLQTEQQFINPNLLNNGGGANSSLFVDDGFLEEPVGACGTANQLIIDEVALSPDIQRRMSEVVTGSIPQQNHSRGSISHQIDFWNLSNDRQSISSGHSTSGRTANNSIDLMSFKKSPTPNVATAGTSITNTSATTLPTVTAGSTNTLPTTTNSSKSNSANNLNGAAPPSVFKIDNELTQLLNDYNIDFSAPSKPSHTPTTRLRASSYVPHTKTNTVTTSSSTGNILSSAAAAAAAAAVATSATSAIPSVSTSRRSNSVSEPQNRVQKQRTSVSLIDGSNPVIMDKLYGDVNNISKFSQWENAIISDEEDHEEKSTNRQLDPKVTLATATVGSKFISPAMLNQDLLENKSFEVRNTSTISTNGISASTRRKRASIPKGPRGTSSKSSSPLEEEEKPFKCQECTKAFRRSEHLKRHIRSVHSTDRPFPCTYCDKKFSRSDNLSQHLKTHRKHGDIKDVLPAASLKKG